MLARHKVHGNALWTHEAELKLIELWKEDRLSAREIADFFGVTRNSVMGKVHRLVNAGLLEGKMAGKPPKNAPPRKRAPSKQSSSLRRRERRIVGVPATTPPHRILPPKVPPASSKYVDIHGLAANHCREVMVQRPVALYCGNDKQRGSSFCPFHHDINWVPARERLR